MLEVVITKEEMLKVQRTLEKQLNKTKHESGRIKAGFPGGDLDIKIGWSEELKIWWGFEEVRNRFWNGFGTEKPDMGSIYSHDITCVINPPYKGINRKAQGIFAKDENRNYYLLHRGIIKSKQSGANKASFVQEFRGRWVEVRDGDRITPAVLIGSLESPRFAGQVATFVHEVDRIKAMRPEDIASKPILSPTFNEEFTGTRTVRNTSDEYEAICNHGLLVKALVEDLAIRGLNIANTKPIDLYVFEPPDEIKIVFEFKTSASTTNYYGAIGQLLYHTADLKTKPKLVAVFPKPIEVRMLEIFKKIGISVLTYVWENDAPVFYDLSILLRS